MKIVKVPISDGISDKGVEKAPDLILNILKSEIWSKEDLRNFSVNESVDGDLFVGGDHSLSYDKVKEFFKKRNNGLVVFDSHPDVSSRRGHEGWLKRLVDSGFVKSESVILVGIRNLDVKEIEYLKEKKIRFFTMKQIFGNIENVCDSVMEMLREFEGFYLSLDIDVVDPAFAPGVNYVEPGGLTSRELIYFIQRLKLLKNLKKVDIVEVNPDKDINNMTSKLAARLIAELI